MDRVLSLAWTVFVAATALALVAPTGAAASSGDITFAAGAGNDTLEGGTQADTCQGQTGNDTATTCEVRTGIP